jgi:hypothetical protein
VILSATSAPALGDLRIAGPDDSVYVRSDAVERRDWGRYWDALGVAYARGADVVLMRGDEL